MQMAKSSVKGRNSRVIVKMSTNMDLPNFESCKIPLSDRPEEREEAINCYSKYIEDAEKILEKNENVARKGEICKQLAIGYNERGFVQYQQVDFEEAIEDYSKALTYDDQLHFTYYNRGLVHYRLGRFDKAISDMNQALHLKTDFEPAIKCLEQAKIDIQGKTELDSASVKS